MSKNLVTIVGDEQFKQLLRLLPQQFAPQIMRAIARKGGRVVVKAVRVQIPGTLGSQIKKDVGVVNDRQNKSGVKVKLRGKYFPDKKGNQQVVSKIAHHFTDGANRKERKTKKGQKRGQVSRTYPDFIKEAGRSSAPEVIRVMQNESVGIIKRHVAKWQRRSR